MTAHLHRGMCPPDFVGYDSSEAKRLYTSRDADCPACRALDAPAPVDWQARVEVAERALAALGREVGKAIVLASLQPHESLAEPSEHAIVATVERLRTRIAELESWHGDEKTWRIGAERARDAAVARAAALGVALSTLRRVSTTVAARWNRLCNSGQCKDAHDDCIIADMLDAALDVADRALSATPPAGAATGDDDATGEKR